VSGEAPESGDKQPGAVPPPAGGLTPPSHGVHIEFNFLEQLKHRNVGRVAILYIVVCYLILEPFSVFIHVLGLPEWIGRTVVLLMVIGFPVALIFAWVYEITPAGLKPTVEVEPSRSIRKQTGQRLNRAITVTLCVALAYFVVDKFWLSKHAASERPERVNDFGTTGFMSLESNRW
jgi:adenylate cyclase